MEREWELCLFKLVFRMGVDFSVFSGSTVVIGKNSGFVEEKYMVLRRE